MSKLKVLALVVFVSVAGLMAYQSANAEMVTAQIKVSGMTCQSCANSIKTTLEDVPGIKSSKVDFKTQSVKVNVNTKTINLAQVKDKIREIGYDVVEN